MGNESDRRTKHDQGRYIGIGISVGMVFGIAVGAATDHIALGLSMGWMIGAGIGVVFGESIRRKKLGGRE